MTFLDRFKRTTDQPMIQVIDTYEMAANALATVMSQGPTWNKYSRAESWHDGYQKLALAFRCINLIAHFVGTAPVRVYDEIAPSVPLPNHSMRRVMKRPNRFMGESSFHATMALRAAVAGFSVAEIEYDQSGGIIGLWPLRSSWLTAKPRADGSVDWEYRVPGYDRPFMLPATKVFVLRWADTPDGSPYGIGPLEACFREIGLLNTMTDFIKTFFDRGAVPLYGLIPDTFPGQTLSQKKTDEMTAEFVQRRTGLRNAAVPVMLQGIKDIRRLGFDFNELATVALRDLSELGIVQAFGVPATVAQIRVGLEHSDSRANAEVDEGRFYRQTIIPFWTRYDDALTTQVLSRIESNPLISLEFDYSGISQLQTDRNEKAAWVNAAVQAGWLSVHAAHKEMYLPTPPGEDYYLRSLMVIPTPATDPLGLTTIQPIPPADEPADDAQLRSASVPALTDGARRHPLDDGSLSANPKARELMAWRERTASFGPRERRAKRAVADRRMIAAVANNRAPSIKSFFNAQKSRVVPQIVSNLANATGPAETYELVNWTMENSRLKKVMDVLYKQAGQAAFNGIEQIHGIDPGISFDVSSPGVRRVMNSLANRVVQINETTRRDIGRVVADGIADGLSQTEIASNLNGLFDETYANRYLAVARTESMVAYGESTVLAAKESGVVDRGQVFDNPDHDEEYGADDGLTCATRDGVVAEIDVVMGHIYADHPNGSAVVTPVLIGEDVD